MTWTRPADLRLQVQKLWNKGWLLTELTRELMGEATSFPLRLPLKGPSATEMSSRFDEVRAWIAEFRNPSHYRIELRTFAHRLLGANSVPHAAWIDSLNDALKLIGKRQEAERFLTMFAQTRANQPALLLWLSKKPLRALEFYQQWDALLKIVAWIQSHPCSDIYLRQVDIPGVHSKFIEFHRAVLAELLDIALPPEVINVRHTGISQFAARYGFCDKPLRIRFRMLDSELSLLSGGGMQDITLDADSFARLDPQLKKVFITENETNFLAFPPLKSSLVIFGAGYGWETLGKAAWLNNCTIHYWGDIDTHGFAILNQLRSQFAHVESFLMDKQTLLAHQTLWGQEDKQSLYDLPRLTAAEQELFDALRDNRIRNDLRLEQEMIGFGWIERALQCVSAASPSVQCNNYPDQL
jgi:hypothetical protein